MYDKRHPLKNLVKGDSGVPIFTLLSALWSGAWWTFFLLVVWWCFFRARFRFFLMRPSLNEATLRHAGLRHGVEFVRLHHEEVCLGAHSRIFWRCLLCAQQFVQRYNHLLKRGCSHRCLSASIPNKLSQLRAAAGLMGSPSKKAEAGRLGSP